METQTRALVKDMQSRFYHLDAAKEELTTLDRAPIYMRLLRRMKMNLKSALFSRQSNHLALARSAADFYTDFGSVVRLLKIDKARGMLRDEQEDSTV